MLCKLLFSFSNASQCIDANVAVESATTRTISRFAKGQRALSYQQHAASGILNQRQKKKSFEVGAFHGTTMTTTTTTSGRSIRQSSHRQQQQLPKAPSKSVFRGWVGEMRWRWTRKRMLEEFGLGKWKFEGGGRLDLFQARLIQLG